MPRRSEAAQHLMKAWGLETKVTNAELVERLAEAHRARTPGASLDDARFYVRHQFTTKLDLALACQRWGIALT